jgi:hypothetical protein
MSKRKKTFPCGHKGYGQNCHRCVQEQVQFEQHQRIKQEWKETFTFDSIDLTNLPKNVVLKARNIIQHLQNEYNYRIFHGKRLRHDRLIVSIPVTRNYRLICRDLGNFLMPEQIVSHEDYNICKPGS